MRLSQAKRQGGQPQQYEQEQVGSIRALATFAHPLSGYVNQRPVQIYATGDVTGLSDASLIVDEHGNFDWVSNSDITVTDGAPKSQEQREQLFKNAHASQGQSAMSGSGSRSGR